MSSEADHISLANRNHALLLHLLTNGAYDDWAITVAFYKAIHVVEAVFANDRNFHSTSHFDRENQLKLPKFKHISRDFSHLSTLSRIARYLGDQAGHVKSFSDVADAAKVRHIIKTRLYGVEQKSLHLLSPAGKASLTKLNTTDV